MINRTRWRPDTCECILEYEWDSNEPSETRAHTLVDTPYLCDAHKSSTDKLSVVLEENQRKNKVIKEMLKISDLSTIDSDGNKVLKKGRMSYYFDEYRKLCVTISGLKSSDKTSLESSIDISKVVING